MNSKEVGHGCQPSHDSKEMFNTVEEPGTCIYTIQEPD